MCNNTTPTNNHDTLAVNATQVVKRDVACVCCSHHVFQDVVYRPPAYTFRAL